MCCDECGTSYEPDQPQCPTCAQRRRRQAGLESACDCYGGDRPYLTVERSDPDDGTTDHLGDDGEAEGWPW